MWLSCFEQPVPTGLLALLPTSRNKNSWHTCLKRLLSSTISFIYFFVLFKRRKSHHPRINVVWSKRKTWGSKLKNWLGVGDRYVHHAKRGHFIEVSQHFCTSLEQFKKYGNRRTGFQYLSLTFKSASVVQCETASTSSNSRFKKPMIIWILQNEEIKGYRQAAAAKMSQKKKENMWPNSPGRELFRPLPSWEKEKG